MHMDPDQLQLIATHHFQRRRQVAVPDAMLAILTAGIGFSGCGRGQSPG